MVTLSTLLPLLSLSSSRCWARIQLRLHHIHLLRDPHYDLLLHVSALSDARLGLGDEAGQAQGEAIDTIDTGPTNGEEACKGQTSRKCQEKGSDLRWHAWPPFAGGS